MLCAGIGEVDACEGDSGGPLLEADSPGGEIGAGRPALDFVMGIVSFGADSCGGGERPGVYTDIGFFYDWIQNVTGRSSSVGPPRAPRPPAPAQPDQSDAKLLERIIEAFQTDDEETVKSVLEQGLDVDSRYNNSEFTFGEQDSTLLMWTTRFDAEKSAQVLLDFNADMEAKDINGDTVLLDCGYVGAPNVAAVLLDNGADVNQRGEFQYTALHAAAAAGHPDVIVVLLNYGADINADDDTDETPLHLAAVYENLESVRVLLERGADVKAVDNQLETPLHEASERGYPEIAELLLGRGASKEEKDENGNTPFEVICAFEEECSEETKTRLEDLLAPN